MHIREFEPSDRVEVWPIFHEVITASETFVYDPHMTSEQALVMWSPGPPTRTTVVVHDDHIVGTAVMGTNRPGPGKHVATASFMVAAAVRGQGIGTALCRDAVAWAKGQGYSAMQFNAVTESNTAAVNTYTKLGFVVVGKVPRAFEHPSLGRVALLVMYNEFEG